MSSHLPTKEVQELLLVLIEKVEDYEGKDVALWLRANRDFWVAAMPVWVKSGSMLMGIMSNSYPAPTLLIVARKPEAAEVRRVALEEWGATSATIVDGKTAQDWLRYYDPAVTVVHVDWSPKRSDGGDA